MMTDADGYVPATSTGLATAGGICILSEDITVGENEYIDTPAYFEGKFNDARVIFQFEGEDDRLLTCEHAVRHHAALVETVCEPLRKAKIFLRHLNS